MVSVKRLLVRRSDLEPRLREIFQAAGVELPPWAEGWANLLEALSGGGLRVEVVRPGSRHPEAGQVPQGYVLVRWWRTRSSGEEGEG